MMSTCRNVSSLSFKYRFLHTQGKCWPSQAKWVKFIPKQDFLYFNIQLWSYFWAAFVSPEIAIQWWSLSFLYGIPVHKRKQCIESLNVMKKTKTTACMHTFITGLRTMCTHHSFIFHLGEKNCRVETNTAIETKPAGKTFNQGELVKKLAQICLLQEQRSGKFPPSSRLNSKERILHWDYNVFSQTFIPHGTTHQTRKQMFPSKDR